MSKLKLLTAPLALAAAVAFAPAAMAEDGNDKTPAVEIDRVGNAKIMAECTADSYTEMFKTMAENGENDLEPENVKMHIEQQMFEILEECAAVATGLSDDQIPDMPALPGENATQEDLMQFMAEAEVFMEFLNKHIDEPTFNAVFSTKMEALIDALIKEAELEEQKLPAPEAVPAPKP